MSDTYNGWTNYATWVVSLWLNNDGGLHDILQELTTANSSKYEAAEALEEYVTELRNDEDADMFTDLLSHALANVNWIEIVEANEYPEN